MDQSAAAASPPDLRASARGLWLAVAAHVAIRGLGLVVLIIGGRLRGTSAYEPLVRWDAVWYRDIARDGYGFTTVHPDGRWLSDYAFFPLYPGLERVVSELTGLRIVDAGLLISAVSSAVAAAGIFAVGHWLFGTRVGVVLVVLWSALPVGIVTSMAYTESLFTALCAWTLYSVLRGRFVAAGVLASLAGLTRPLGGAVVLAVVISAALLLYSRRHSAPVPDRASGARVEWVVGGALIAPLGMVGYLGWVAVQREGLLAYFDVGRQWGNGLDGGASFLAWVGGMFTGSDAVLGLLICAGLVVLAWALVALVQGRYPACLVVFAGVTVLLAMSTSGYFGSKPRYLLPAFPLLLPLAVVLARARPVVTITGLALSTLAGSVYGAIWLFGPGPP